MTNLIKMDLYRLIKMRGLYIVLLISTIMQYLMTRGMTIMFTIGADVTDTPVLDSDYQLSNIMQTVMGGGFFQLFVGIIVILFLTKDMHTGFIKSYIGQLKSRLQYIFSKLICCAIFLLAYYVLIVVLECLLLAICTDGYEFGDVAELLQIMGMYYLLQFALICVFLMFSVLIRSHAGSIMLTVVTSLGFASMITSILMIFSYKYDWDIDFDKYLITQQMVQLGEYGIDAGEMVPLALVYIILSLLISCLVFRKKDL